MYWDVSDIYFHEKDLFDYRKGDVVVKLLMTDYKENSNLEAYGYLHGFEYDKRLVATKGLTKILDVRVLPGQLSSILGYDINSLKERGETFGFEVRIKEMDALLTE